ncbi:MAG TPA: DUF6283 family protein [Jiangellaceae bacterium]|nr:DUF6283 family protein [Jiangellaceae bacterium]
MKKPEITRVRPADENNQVVTVEGGGGNYRRQPCGGCPWRVDQTGSFPAEAFGHSAETAYDMSTHMFGCHESGKDRPATCAGFLLRGAYNNMAWRLKVSSGQIDMRQVSDGGHELHDGYRAMAVANGLDEDDPRLRRCVS